MFAAGNTMRSLARPSLVSSPARRSIRFPTISSVHSAVYPKKTFRLKNKSKKALSLPMMKKNKPRSARHACCFLRHAFFFCFFWGLSFLFFIFYLFYSFATFLLFFLFVFLFFLSPFSSSFSCTVFAPDSQQSRACADTRYYCFLACFIARFIALLFAPFFALPDLQTLYTTQPQNFVPTFSRLCRVFVAQKNDRRRLSSVEVFLLIRID